MSILTETPARRSVPVSLEVRDEGDRELAGYAVTRERNSYGEVFVPGCFQESLDAKSDRKPFVMGWLHKDPIGRWTEFKEERDEGLHVAGKISDTVLGRDALTLVGDGAVTGLSIGFFLAREEFVPDGSEVTFDTPWGKVSYQNDAPTFYVTEADVVEASLVMTPADDEARIGRGATLVDALPGLLPDATAEVRAEGRELITRGRFDELPTVRRRTLEAALDPSTAAAEPSDPSELEREIERFREVLTS